MKTITLVLGIIYFILLYLLDELFNFSSVTTFTLLIPILFCMINPLLNLVRMKKKILNNQLYYFVLDIILIINIDVLLNNVCFMIKNPEIAYLHNFDYLLYTTPLFLIPYIYSFFIKKETIIGKDNSIIILLFISILCGISLIDKSLGLRYLINVISTIVPIYIISKLETTIMTRTELQKIYFILGILSLYGGNIFVTLLYIILYLNTDYNNKNI